MEPSTYSPHWRLPVYLLPLLARWDDAPTSAFLISQPGSWVSGSQGIRTPQDCGQESSIGCRKSRAGSSGSRSLDSLVAEPIAGSRCLAAEHRPPPPPTLPAPPHLHDLPGLHAERGEVAAPVNGDRLAQQRVQPLHLWPAQSALVPSRRGRGGLRVRAAAAGRPSRGHGRGRIHPHLRSWPLQALNSTLRRHHSPGPGAPTAETREWLRRGEQ